MMKKIFGLLIGSLGPRICHKSLFGGRDFLPSLKRSVWVPGIFEIHKALFGKKTIPLHLKLNKRGSHR
jgi:hypothetical protein